jgi:chromosome segregation ATPase
MAKTLYDFSQLKSSMLKTAKLVEVERESDVIEHEEGADVLAYFSKASSQKIMDKTAVSKVQEDECLDALKAELAAKDEILSELAAEKVAADDRAKGLETNVRELGAELARAKEEISQLKARCARLQREAQENLDKVESDGPQKTEDKMVGRKNDLPQALLAPVADVEERFPGELREVVIAALLESKSNAEQSGRERRAVLLSKLLGKNASSGELERRRGRLRQILRNAGYFTDMHVIRELESLGFKLVSGKKHWKLEYGNIRFPVSKTPSDYRSNRNTLSQIENKCF